MSTAGILTAGSVPPEVAAWLRARLATEALLAGLRHSPAVNGARGAKPMTAIEVVGLRKSYGSREVLRGVDLDVVRGEVFCLLGPNGAGKTTAVEVLEGFRSRDSGEVRVLGSDPQGQPPGLRSCIGIVLQECALPGELRVRELLDAYRSYYSAPLSTERLLSIVELQEQAGALIRELSGGQRRRVDLALALAGDPDLVFLDEPTTGFDPAARRRTWSAIRNLADLGKTVVLTTHYLDEAQMLSDRVAVIIDGQVVACDSPQRLADRHLAPTRVCFELTTEEGRLDVPLVEDASVEYSGDRVKISTRDPETQLRALLAWAPRNRRRLSGLSVSPPTLEDVYLGLVGQAEEESK